MLENLFRVGGILRRVGSPSDQGVLAWPAIAVPTIQFGDFSKLTAEALVAASLFGCDRAGAVGVKNSFQIQANSQGGSIVKIMRVGASTGALWMVIPDQAAFVGANQVALTNYRVGFAPSVAAAISAEHAGIGTAATDPYFHGTTTSLSPHYTDHGFYLAPGRVLVVEADTANSSLRIAVLCADVPADVGPPAP